MSEISNRMVFVNGKHQIKNLTFQLFNLKLPYPTLATLATLSYPTLPYEAWNRIFPVFSIYGIRPFHLSFAPFSTIHFKMAPTSTEGDTTATNQGGIILPHNWYFSSLKTKLVRFSTTVLSLCCRFSIIEAIQKICKTQCWSNLCTRQNKVLRLNFFPICWFLFIFKNHSIC